MQTDTELKTARVLLAALEGHCPLSLAVETTGVGSEDTITAVSVKPLNSPVMTVLTHIPEEKLETSLGFLGMPRDVYETSPKLSLPGIIRFLSALSAECSRNGKIAPIVYNAPFQQRFLTPLAALGADLGARVETALDLTRLAWCVRNAPALRLALQDGLTLDEIQYEAAAMSARERGTGYKQVFPAWDIELPDPLRPCDKPELIERLLVRLCGAESAAALADRLGLPAFVDTELLHARAADAENSTTLHV